MLHQLAATIVDTHTSNIRADIVAFVADMEGGGDGQTSPTTPSNTASSNLSPNGATPDTKKSAQLRLSPQMSAEMPSKYASYVGDWEELAASEVAATGGYSTYSPQTKGIAASSSSSSSSSSAAASANTPNGNRPPPLRLPPPGTGLKRQRSRLHRLSAQLRSSRIKRMMRQVFAEWDVRKKGFIRKKQFIRALQKMGLFFSSRQMSVLFKVSKRCIFWWSLTLVLHSFGHSLNCTTTNAFFSGDRPGP
jgi:hypothetical protein